MATRQASRIPARRLLVVVLVALAVCSSVSSAAKCVPKIRVPTTTTAPDVVGFDFPDTETPTVADSPNQQTTDTPTQVTTDAPETPEVTTSTQITNPAELSNSAETGSLPTQSSSEGSSAETPSTGSLPTQTSSEGSSAETPSTTSNSTGEHAIFGDITSGSDKCVVGNPNEYISAKYVDWVWKQRMSKYVPQFKNYILDQLVTNKGSLKYCVRWDSTNKLSKTVASKFEAMLNRQFKAWNEWLIGYDCWPFEQIDVKIVGWATRDASLFDWTDDSLGTIYTTENDADGVPQCPESCYKHKDFAASADTSACKGEPFDMSLWPTLGQGGGAGGDWGQRVDADNMLSTIDGEELTIVAHEIGHGFGLPDFYETTDKPAEDFPKCIMEAVGHLVSSAAIFAETAGSRCLAPATPIFWRIWQGNTSALRPRSDQASSCISLQPYGFVPEETSEMFQWIQVVIMQRFVVIKASTKKRKEREGDFALMLFEGKGKKPQQPSGVKRYIPLVKRAHPTSNTVERLFSQCKLAMTPERRAILQVIFEQLAFLRFSCGMLLPLLVLVKKGYL